VKLRSVYFGVALVALATVPYSLWRLFGAALAVGAIRGTVFEQSRLPAFAAEQYIGIALLFVGIVLCILFFRAGLRAKR
jgi:hypothetical protein